MAIRRLAKPSARELFDHRHISIDQEAHDFALCACIRMTDHLKEETIYG